MIDLSFLTEAEQEAILKVLNRDAELKKAEDERIRHLQNVLEDENELKYKTGEWFYEAKSRRHREKIHGADLVRASIRKRKKPATIAELSQSNKDKSRKSWVNSVNKDIFIPPELCGVMEEPEEDFEDLKQTKVQSNQSSKKVSFSPAQNKENLNNGTASPAKIRRNPFNSPLEEIETDGKHQPPDNGLPKRDILSSIIKYGVKLPYPDTQEATQDSRTTAESENSIVQVPTPKPRIMSLKKVSQPPYDSSTSLKEHSINSTGRPKGILKRWSSSSSTDSETVRISQGVDSNRIIFPGSPILEYETNLSKDGIDQSLEITNEQSKQVRFAANIMEKPPSPILESFSGREIGEFRILEPVIHQNEWEDPGIASSDDSTQLEHSSFPNSADFSEDRSEEVHSHSTNVQKTSNVHPNLNVENVIGTASPKGGRTNNTERLLEGQTNVISFTSHTNNSDLEPIYAVVNKSQKQSSPDFEKEDTEMEPLVFGQEGKDKNIATGGQPLEFGKSFGGSGKIHFNAIYQDQEFQTAEDVSQIRPAYPESYHTLGKDSEDKPPSDGEQGYVDSTGYVPDNQSDEEQYINMAWRKPHILEKNIFKRKSSENITKDQRMLAPKPKEFQSVRQNSNVEQSIFVNHGQDGLKGTIEYSPRERKIQSPYNSLDIKSVHQAEENKPVDLSTALFSRNVARPNLSSDGRDNVSTAYLKKEESPSSYNFKIMSLKDRINSGPSEQIFNPSQFHNLKSFWNVEEKKKPEEESTIEIVTGVHKKLRSGKSGIQQRNSTENDSDPLKLSSSFDSLSEEEQTSQKVASWLAQTPSAHDEQQTYATEEQLYPEEEIDENVTKSIATQKSNVGEFSRALEKLREEALLVPNVTEPKIVDINQDIKILPQEHPDVHNVKSVKIRNSETSALANMNTVEQADNKVKSSDRFFERVMNISHGRSLNETPSTFTEPDDQPRNSIQVLDWKDQAKYDVPTVQFRHDDNADIVNSEQEYACEQPIEKECAPTNNANIAFKFGIDKLMKEYESTEPIDQPRSSIQVLDWKDQAKFDVPTVHIRHDANVDMVNSEQEYACEEPIEKECAPTNNANIAFKFGIDKLMKEYESVKMEDNSMYKTSPEEQPKEYQTKESNSHENNMIEEEVIEKTVVPAKKELCEFITALSKLEIEASQPTHIPEDSTSIEQGLPFENTRKEPNFLVEPSIIRDNDSKSYQMISHKDKTELNVRALIKSASNSSLEIETPDGEYKLIKRKSSNEDGIGFVDTKAISPVQEAIEKSVGETREEKYSLIQLQEEILPNYNKSLTTEDAEELEDQEKDGNVNVYNIPYSRMHIFKKIYSDIDEQPSNHNESQVEEQIKTEETQRNKVPFEQSPEAKASIIPLKDAHKFSAARFKSPPKIAAYHQSGSYTANTGNVLYKQPETDVPELPKPDFVEINQGSEEFNPVLNALQRITVKPIYVRDQERTKEDVDLSDQEVPTEDSQVRSQFSNPEKLKRLSQSVPAFLEETDGRETDSASESSFQIGRHRKSPSSLTNLSSSSGMASLSSVSGSVMSVYSGDFGNVDVKGNIQFAIDYVEQLREFHIFVAQCKDLAVADLRKLRSDPYVKSYLLPDKAKMGKRKTAVRKKTVNPSYNEILRYKIEKQNLLNQTLNLSVWHNDALGRNSFLGEVDLNLATWDWSNKQMNWYPLQPRTPASGIGLENRGEMKLALKYIPEVSPGTKVPVTGEVHIWIKECYQLPMLRGNKINSFVKCTILPDTSRKSRQKTRTVDRTPNPVFNHTMVYDGFRYDDLGEACVELTVWDHNRLSNHFLGGLRLGLGTGKSYGTAVDWMDSSIEESTMWESMIKAPDTWIEGLVPLRMLRMAKLTK
ncbi:synaptotagmin-like protein 2 isoform X3 [Bombina bombina]|uniref:synaptotagmin-like protein 2 isoform X3 n=1 Tax=Bombina bombina TaxID=8345 RepID=UPI00235AFA05|nr:synaptotagmin-like protein 2 isoform X3 [Bombina bombina]